MFKIWDISCSNPIPEIGHWHSCSRSGTSHAQILSQRLATDTHVQDLEHLTLKSYPRDCPPTHMHARTCAHAHAHAHTRAHTHTHTHTQVNLWL